MAETARIAKGRVTRTKTYLKKYPMLAAYIHLPIHQRLRQYVLDHYGNKCACCGETIQMFLSVDHVDNNGVEHSLKEGVRGGHDMYRWLMINDFPDGFQLLCRNCNWGKHVNGGVCPHKTLAED